MLLFSSGGYIFRDNHDDLFDDEGPPNKYKEYSDDFRDEEYTEVERTHTTRTEKNYERYNKCNTQGFTYNV